MYHDSKFVSNCHTCACIPVDADDVGPRGPEVEKDDVDEGPREQPDDAPEHPPGPCMISIPISSSEFSYF